MKRYNKPTILGWMAASALLLTTACSDNGVIENPSDSPVGKSTVTFTISPESRQASSRAVHYPGVGEYPAISDGSKADKLVFAVYKVTQENGQNVYTLCPEFGDEGNADGQRVITGTTFPVTFQLQPEAETTYRIVLWAQTASSDAYDTHDLRKVKVNYANAANNDELRDAFCGVKDFTGNELNVDITLMRPLAQINVGTAGYDYEGVAALKPSPVSYSESEVTIDGVAQYYDVLTGKTLNADQLNPGETATTSVTFTMSRIPAFFNLTDEEMANLDYFAYNENVTYPYTENDEVKRKAMHAGYKENFLKIALFDEEIAEGRDLDGDGYRDYFIWADYLAAKRADNVNFDPESEAYQTETFKYLSMCYVLVPEAKTLTDVPNVSYGSVLNKVSLKLKGQETTTDNTQKPVMTDIFTVNNVPVQKNWRTNIVGNSLLLTTATFKLYIVPDYCGDWNNTDVNDNSPSQGWQNVVGFDDSDNNNWTLKEGSTGNQNGGFRDPAAKDDDPNTPGYHTQSRRR